MVDVLRIVAEAADADAGPRQVGRGGEGLDQPVLALARGQRGHAQEAGDAVGAGGEGGDVGARGGDMDPVGGQAVVRDEAADRPLAGADHRGHRAQDRALLGVQLGGDGGIEAGLVTERKVDQDGQAQPVGLRDDDLGDPAGHDPVHEDGGAVRQLAQYPGEFGTGVRAGAGPLAVHGVLVDLPAEAGQVQADAAVVRVAAARRGRVVDTARHHEVHGAQGHGDDLGIPGGRALRGQESQRGGGTVDGHVAHRARS